MYACTPVGGRLLEGYVDLLYRRADGLVVVDYKTAATNDLAELAAASRATGSRAPATRSRSPGDRRAGARVTFLFLTPNGPVERHLDDLDAAVAEVETQVAEASETVVLA